MNILEVQEVLKGMPEDQIAREIRNPTGQIPPFLALSELNRRKEAQAAYKAKAAAANRPSSTIAQELGGAAMQQRPQPQQQPQQPQAPRPPGFASGGAVSPAWPSQQHHRPGTRPSGYRDYGAPGWRSRTRTPFSITQYLSMQPKDTPPLPGSPGYDNWLEQQAKWERALAGRDPHATGLVGSSMVAATPAATPAAPLGTGSVDPGTLRAFGLGPAPTASVPPASATAVPKAPMSDLEIYRAALRSHQLTEYDQKRMQTPPVPQSPGGGSVDPGTLRAFGLGPAPTAFTPSARMATRPPPRFTVSSWGSPWSVAANYFGSMVPSGSGEDTAGMGQGDTTWPGWTDKAVGTEAPGGSVGAVDRMTSVAADLPFYRLLVSTYGEEEANRRMRKVMNLTPPPSLGAAEPTVDYLEANRRMRGVGLAGPAARDGGDGPPRPFSSPFSSPVYADKPHDYFFPGPSEEGGPNATKDDSTVGGGGASAVTGGSKASVKAQAPEVPEMTDYFEPLTNRMNALRAKSARYDDQIPGLALMRAGLGIMGTPGHWSTAVSQGGTAGLDFYTSSKEKGRGNEMKMLQAETLMAKGRDEAQRGNADLALRYQKQALDLVNSESTRDLQSAQAWDARQEPASLRYVRGLMEMSEEDRRQALEIQRSMSANTGVGWHRAQIANRAKNLERYDIYLPQAKLTKHYGKLLKEKGEKAANEWAHLKAQERADDEFPPLGRRAQRAVYDVDSLATAR